MPAPESRVVERKIGDEVFRFETGRLARLASGAVLASVGETTVLATAASAAPRPGGDFFPLTVDVEERMYAAGKIPGGFFRREGRATEKAILTARLIDRPLRPAFPDGMRNEVHCVVTAMAVDQENPMDILALNAASAALVISDIPFDGPVGAVRVSHIDGEWIANPTWDEQERATIELVVAGRQNDRGEVDIMMIEAGGSPNLFDLIAAGAKAPDEELLAEGLEYCKPFIAEAIGLQHELREVAGQEKGSTEGPDAQFALAVDYTPEVFERVRQVAEAALRDAITIEAKADRKSVV